MKRIVVAIGLVAGLGSCLTNSEDFLSVLLDRLNGGEITAADFPIQVMADTAQFEGEVVRTPPRQGLTTEVTVTGGSATVTATVNPIGIFRVTVPLTRNATNTLAFTARDDSGALSQPLTLAVTHVP